MPINEGASKSRTLMYTQQLGHMPFGDLGDVLEAVEGRLGPRRFAGIVHDRDTSDNGKPAEDHVHVMMAFENPRSPANVAKLLGDKPQSIEVWSGKNVEKNGFSYLCHRTKGAMGKHQYSPSAVRANFDYVGLLAEVEAEVARAGSGNNLKLLLDALLDGAISKEELLGRLSGHEYARAKRQIEDVYNRRLQIEASEWRSRMLEEGAKIRTLWLFGPAGTGKTSLAKKYAEGQGEPYFVSGSTRDIFQGYAGQHTVILDELRPESIGYADLLRITDPNALEHEVMAPARYSDKPLACGLIIVTSPYDPSRFYAAQTGKQTMAQGGYEIDSFGQLERRVELAIGMSQSEICLAEFRDMGGGIGGYLPIDGSQRPNPYSRASRDRERSADAIEAYESVLS